ncbi:MAG: hypothetical protein R6W96_01880 [Clostridia bacterium]
MARKNKAILLSEHGVNMIVNIFPSKRPEFKSFSWKDIREITIRDDFTSGLFKKSTEVIEILTENPETPTYFNPVIFYKTNESNHFDEMVSELQKFALEKNKKFDDQRKAK